MYTGNGGGDENTNFTFSRKLESLHCATVLLADRLCKLWKFVESNYKIMAVDFASRYCVSRGNSTNTHPILKTDT